MDVDNNEEEESILTKKRNFRKPKPIPIPAVGSVDTSKAVCGDAPEEKQPVKPLPKAAAKPVASLLSFGDDEEDANFTVSVGSFRHTDLPKQLKKKTTVVEKYQKRSKDAAAALPRVNTYLPSAGEYTLEKLEALKQNA